MVDTLITRCTSCRAVGTYKATHMFSEDGIITWALRGGEWTDVWYYGKFGYLPSLCNMCAERRCPVCGK